ncbi:MAG: di-trans,poly-cis-decaprenylcistransferase [Proteobacteria bacterium]|nr:di-trans,poly-cis-decaprenylcistransferase [Pseudomonadota bacterium]
MDGNGRWAKRQNLSRTKGHIQGVQTVREVIGACQEKNISVLTLFAFGVENWKRPTKEVRNLFRLFFLVLRKDIAKLHENSIKLKIIGDRTVLHKALVSAINEAEDLTRHNTGLQLNIAVNYSGRWDLLNGIQKLMKDPMSKKDINEDAISQVLSLAGLPEPDLFIRTGGVQRISNFMLWELAYTELYFTNTLWPDFNKSAFELALNDYASRERRFGLTAEQLG